jgi:hypothetical protein
MKRGMSGSIRVSIALVAGLMGCTKMESEAPPTLSEVVLIDESQEAVDKKKALDVKMKKKGKPLAIGGCHERCSDHAVSFQNYLEALRTEGSEATIPFLETSEMVHDGARRGDVWVQEWKDGALKKRKASILEFGKEIGAWVGKTTPEALDVAIATGISFEEDDEPGYVVRCRHPPIAGDASSPVWMYRLQKRGWEWLISEIRMQSL